MHVLRRFLVNSLLASRLVPIGARGRLYALLGMDTRARCSFGLFFGELNARLGHDTYVNAECFFDGSAPVTIGDGCLIGMQAMFLTSAHDLRSIGVYGPPVGQPITVGDRCWIGARATILPGVQICDDTVVAAGAVVAQSLTVPGIYGGVPARLIREFGTENKGDLT